jgi:Tfp pilus assembly major pilin PilA
MKTKSAFTLFEMIAIISIIAIVFVITIPLVKVTYEKNNPKSEIQNSTSTHIRVGDKVLFRIDNNLVYTGRVDCVISIDTRCNVIFSSHNGIPVKISSIHKNLLEKVE